jgi:hypothetical protein
MDNKKYETLINLIINEDETQARELFHDIVVEKSREIYESIMEEEMMDDEGMGGQVGDLLDEINAEESGVTEEDESDVEFDDEAEEDGEDLTHDMEMDHDDGEDSEEVEDAVIRIEDKLDQLMAEFEEIMGGDTAGDDLGDEEVDFEAGSEEEVMEAVQLQKVSVTHGDNGVQTKSPVAANAGKAGMDSKPVNFGSADEKGRTAPTAKDVEGASKFKNAPGHKSQDLSSAPKPVTKDGSAYDKSPVAK